MPQPTDPPKGEFTIKVSKTDTTKDLPTVNPGKIRQEGVNEGVAITLTIVGAIVLALTVILILATRH